MSFTMSFNNYRAFLDQFGRGSVSEKKDEEKGDGDDDDDDVIDDNSNNNNNNDKKSTSSCCCSSYYDKIQNFYWTNEFLILAVIVILLAKAYPPLGAEYLVPEITSTWIAVIFIFLLAGLSLKTQELNKAIQQIWFNLYVQIYNFGIVSGIAYGVSTALNKLNMLTDDLASGMIICSCLPMTINMINVLTAASNGDDASAILNSAVSNMISVFLSPLLILMYIGTSTNDDDDTLNLFDVFIDLIYRVVLPVIAGQILQKCFSSVVEFAKKHKAILSRIQQYALIYIVYTVFCRTFQKGSSSSIGDIFLMILFQFILMAILMILAWYTLKMFFPKQPKLRVMGLYGCTHKSVATGLPLITAIYSNNTSVGLYTLPLLIWHPMQLIIGTFLSPRLAQFVVSEQERLQLDETDQPITTTITAPNNININNNHDEEFNRHKQQTTEDDELLLQQSEEGR